MAVPYYTPSAFVQGLQVGCPDEIAYRAGWIDRADLAARAAIFRKNDYGRYLAAVLLE